MTPVYVHQILHGCKDCGEESYPVIAHARWVCRNCHSANILCIETDTDLLGRFVDQRRKVE